MQAVSHNQRPSASNINQSVVRNVVEVFLLGSFFSTNTENVKALNPVTYPQGKLKRCEQLFSALKLPVLQ